LPEAARQLRTIYYPPDRVEQLGGDGLRLHFGDWCVTLTRPIWFGLKVVCTACRRGRLLFDSDRHGANVFRGAPDPADDQVPCRLWPWRCLRCGSVAHTGFVHFRFDDAEDFVRDSEGRYKVDRRVDAFRWFGMRITCCGCGHATAPWAGYETG
jgi:hypothetical protein